ncbi:Crp/Fnr family transcriptional regulator [Aestuariicella hydrocarbonica]|uniref:Crp/Fnr family transcriptional regulator n=1 Tax=Pseudomaricurvus hydrocarbonicus TaxID=1470433 RepID=A0A9E5JWR1_9GAMM|nr:Crp/Fnr family transcriptional regulator [Aestuariicella hydrocarbonica]NHO66310.1 Crp/Fnr family transcriptional regulator [Aestuariicella hydrocarbonica]
MVDKTLISTAIRENVWFQGMPEDMLDRLVAMASIKTLADGAYLYAKNEEADGIYAVLAGAIVAGGCSENGKRAVYAVLEPGSWVGEASMFDRRPRVSDAIAKGETKILFIPRVKFQQLLDERPQLYKYFIGILCEHYRQASRLVEASMMRSVTERLALRLLDLTARYDFSCQDGKPASVKVSQEELSLMAGTTRQRINQELKSWEKHGWIEVSYGYVTILDRAALEGLLTLI